MPDPLLLILAMDHRDSLERELYGLTAPPTPAEGARIAADKVLVYRALLDAAAHLDPGARAGVLVDEEYGASVAELQVNKSVAGDVSGASQLELHGRPAKENRLDFRGLAGDRKRVIVFWGYPWPVANERDVVIGERAWVFEVTAGSLRKRRK